MSATLDLGERRIVPLLDAFMEMHPEIRVDLELSDGRTDLIAGGFDLAVRFQVPEDSAMVARRLAGNRRVVRAAPSYVETHGLPQHPDQLDSHTCLIMRFGQDLDNLWHFLVDGKRRRIAVNGNRIANDGRLMRRRARACIEIRVGRCRRVGHRRARQLSGFVRARAERRGRRLSFESAST